MPVIEPKRKLAPKQQQMLDNFKVKNETLKHGFPSFYKDRVLSQDKQEKINWAVEEIFKAKELEHGLQVKAKYYQTKEEVYRKFNFNENEKDLEMRFKLKRLKLLKEQEDKESRQQQQIKRFLAKVHRLENPLVNQLLVDKLNHS